MTNDPTAPSIARNYAKFATVKLSEMGSVAQAAHAPVYAGLLVGGCRRLSIAKPIFDGEECFAVRVGSAEVGGDLAAREAEGWRVVAVDCDWRAVAVAL